MNPQRAHTLALRRGQRVAVQLEPESCLRWLGCIAYLDPEGKPVFEPDNAMIECVVLSWHLVDLLEVNVADLRLW
jgi:hypothetical protein